MIQNRGPKYWRRIPYRKPPKSTICRYFRCHLRYYGQNDIAETGFNAPMYLILLRYKSVIRMHVICTRSRLLLMKYYMKMIFFFQYYILQLVTLLNINNWQSIKARKIMFAVLKRVFKYLTTNYKVMVIGAMYKLWKWTMWAKVLISKGYSRKYNMRNAM